MTEIAALKSLQALDLRDGLTSANSWLGQPECGTIIIKEVFHERNFVRDPQRP
jgi:hypothetical protein